MISRLAVLFMFAVRLSLFGQTGGRVALGQSTPPQFRIAFKSGDPVRGLNYLPVFVLPFECTSDGTVYVEMLTANRLVDPSNLGSRALAGITLSGDVHSYSVAGTPELNDMEQVSHFVWGSGIGFLVRAHRDSKADKFADYHDYIVRFKLDGERQDVIQISDAFRAVSVAVFPSSGDLLIYGYDSDTAKPKLAIFNSDGTLLKELKLRAGLLRQSAAMNGVEMKEMNVDKVLPERQAEQDAEKSQAHIIAPVQFVPLRNSVIFVQADSDLPLLEIKDGGTVRAISVKLPPGEKIYSFIPSDGNLFARVKSNKRNAIYEIDPETGELLKRFKNSNTEDGSNIACVHENMFLSFEHDWAHDHALIPLWGTPEQIVGGNPPSVMKKTPQSSNWR